MILFQHQNWYIKMVEHPLIDSRILPSWNCRQNAYGKKNCVNKPNPQILNNKLDKAKYSPNSYLPKNSTKEGNNMITVHICTTNILCHIINFDDM